MNLNHLPAWGKLIIAAIICAGCGLVAYGLLRLFGIA